jgi:hypothetical protein
MENANSVAGVRGWLAFLVVLVGVLTPLAQMGSLVALFNAAPVLRPVFGENWESYLVITSIIIGMKIIICLLVARALIWQKVASTPRFAIAGLWIVYCLFGMLSLAIFGVLNPKPFPITAGASRLIWPLIICVIATAYLLRSKRVANTYMSETEDNMLINV